MDHWYQPALSPGPNPTSCRLASLNAIVRCVSLIGGSDFSTCSGYEPLSVVQWVGWLVRGVPGETSWGKGVAGEAEPATSAYLALDGLVGSRCRPQGLAAPLR